MWENILSVNVRRRNNSWEKFCQWTFRQGTFDRKHLEFRMFSHETFCQKIFRVRFVRKQFVREHCEFVLSGNYLWGNIFWIQNVLSDNVYSTGANRVKCKIYQQLRYWKSIRRYRVDVGSQQNTFEKSLNTVDFFNTAAKSLRVTISISVSTITFVSHTAVTESDIVSGTLVEQAGIVGHAFSLPRNALH